MNGPAVVVEPETFTLVKYDATEISRLVSEVGVWVGLRPDETLLIKVDESSPLGMTVLESEDPIVVAVEGGAFEDVKVIRQLDPFLTQMMMVRVLTRVADRRLPAFAGAPDEASVTVAQLDCWDASALGRAVRHGLPVAQQRWRHRFRTRHGFTDVADRVFERLWAQPDIGWADLEAACAETAAAKTPVG